MSATALFEEDGLQAEEDGLQAEEEALADLDLLGEEFEELGEFEEGLDLDGLDVTDEFEDRYADYSVIEDDERFQIRSQARRPSTLQFPFNTICFIEAATATGFSHRGTGTLIAPQVVLTAKHVLQNVTPPCAPSTAAVMGPPIPRLRVTPGADLSATSRQRPASPPSMIVPSSRFRVDPRLDYGIIVLPRPFRRPSRFMMLQPRSDLRTATLLTIAGYPCDKPVGTMWGHSDRIPITAVTGTHLRYRIDTCPGHSGSPIWLLGNNEIRLLLGVHTTGAGGPTTRCPNAAAGQCLPTGAPVAPATGSNCGVRITCHIIRFIEQVCRGFRVRGPVVDRVAFRRVCA